MENIQELLDKITRIYQQGISSKIDQDLLLDYTRKFYEEISAIDLNISAFPIHKAPETNNETSTDAHIYDTTVRPILVAQTTEDVENTVHEEVTEQPAEIVPENANNEEAEIETGASEITESVAEELSEKEEEITEDTTFSDEEQLEENLMQQQRNISFEPPHPSEENPLLLFEGIEEDLAEENVLPPQTIPVDNVAPQQKEEEPVVSDYAKIFNFSTATPNRTTTADIRKKIGINDKYLFLNELFNSNKPAYEKALDQINSISQYPEAVDWVKDNPAMTYKWHDDDDTVLDFYEVLRKHFKDR